MQETKEKSEKKDYTNLLLGITGVTLGIGLISSFVSGYYTAWNICNNQMSMKEAQYVARGYLTQEQISEVYDECFKPKV